MTKLCVDRAQLIWASGSYITAHHRLDIHRILKSATAVKGVAPYVGAGDDKTVTTIERDGFQPNPFWEHGMDIRVA